MANTQHVFAQGCYSTVTIASLEDPLGSESKFQMTQPATANVKGNQQRGDGQTNSCNYSVSHKSNQM
jgi:hypothetical protein